ncbi:hypothetical protein [Lysinibacillus odysseyi]|uniref:Uncharacterized protein n=1 Tax=Lysinibacillus odysseyi 34hs-1 = NBRC 100172 TaxID=1220589 RepID=A0A0A3IUM4_9BACI|nr:hypothetical protein [Lysinibacillus odysseyi]KGR88386.1 hypothetical protein CD32_01610 [Lysinibacillus odysseyi 34hs-1 = NBRC 100172]
MASQTLQLRYLIPEFYPAATDFIVDEVEERVYFENEGNGEMQAHIDRENEWVAFYYKQGEDWRWADGVIFWEADDVNGEPIFNI